MPRVPPGAGYVSEVGVPGTAPYEQASGTMLAAPAREAQAGFQTTEDISVTALRHLQYIEAEKTRQKRANDVLTGINGASNDVANLENGLQNGYKDPVSGDWHEQVGSDNYVQSWQNGFKDIQQKYLDDVDDPQTKLALSTGLKRLYDSRLFHAYDYSNRLHVAEQDSNDLVNMQQAAGLAANADTPEARDLAINTFNSMTDLKYHGTRPKYVESLKQKTQQMALEGYAKNLIQTDPERFQIENSKGYFSDVNPVKMRELLREGKTALKQQAAERDRDVKAMQTTAVGQIYRDGWAGVDQRDKIANIKAGNDPLLSVDDHNVRAAIDWVESGKHAPTSQQIGAIYQSYVSRGVPDAAWIKTHRDLLNNVTSQQTSVDPNAVRLFNKLNSDELALQRRGNVDLNKGVQDIRTFVGGEVKANPFPFPSSTFQHDKVKQIENQAIQRLRNGDSMDEIKRDLHEQLSTNKNAAKPQGGRNKLNELLGGE